MKKLLLSFLLYTAYTLQAQNIGIGTTTPTGPLSFNSILGNKIVLWGDGNAAHYGFGIQNAQLQMYSDAPAANIVFGYGRSGSFTERMRIINGGSEGLILNGRVTLRNGTSPVDPAYGAGIWMLNGDNSATLGFMGVQNNQNVGFYGGPAGWGFTYDAINSRVGIGNNNPNAPLAFPASLGKKITLYPGATGDVGFGVAGNRLQIYSDNPNADVAIGYDAAGTFNERFAVKPTGAIAVNGNIGSPGQQLISNGAAQPATWVPRPYVIFFTRSGFPALTGSTLCSDIGGVNGASFSLATQSWVSYAFSIPLFGDNGSFGGASSGGVVIQFLNSSGQVVSQANSQYNIGNLISSHITVNGVGDLPAGNYTVVARLVRNSTSSGNTQTNAGTYGTSAGCNNITIYAGQLIINVFPR